MKKEYNILLILASILFAGAVFIACYCMISTNPRPQGGCSPQKEEIDHWAKYHHQYQLDIEEDGYTLWDATGGHRIGQAKIHWKEPLAKLILKDNQ